AGHVVAADAREVATLGEAPERRFGIAGERPVDPVLARVISGKSERPVAVALVEEAEVARGGARGPLGLQAVVAMGVHHQPEAAGGGAGGGAGGPRAAAPARGGGGGAPPHPAGRSGRRGAAARRAPPPAAAGAGPARP